MKMTCVLPKCVLAIAAIDFSSNRYDLLLIQCRIDRVTTKVIAAHRRKERIIIIVVHVPNNY